MNVNLENDITFQRIQAWMLRGNYHGGIRRINSTNTAIATDIGFDRSQNQDRVIIARGKDFNGDVFILAALCDGMGGMHDGEYCAATSIAAFLSSFFKISQKLGMTNDWLMSSAMEANRFLNKKYLGAGGATLSAILLKPDGKAHWINVGDSRIYQATPSGVTQLTCDDTIAGQLGTQPTSRSSELLQYIGIGEVLEPHISRTTLDSDSSIILTSDGIHYLPAETFNSLILKSKDAGTCARRLIEVAKWCSGHDNCSTAIIEGYAAKNFNSTHILTGQYDIWDPFGELQLFNELTDTSKPVAESYKNRIRKISQPKPSEPKKQSRATGKTKKEIKKNIETTETVDLRLEKLPQLKITFPIKDD